MIVERVKRTELDAQHIDQGDIIFTGTPAGVGPVLNKDHFACKLADKALGSCIIKLSK